MRYIFFLFLFILFSCKSTNVTSENPKSEPPVVKVVDESTVEDSLNYVVSKDEIIVSEAKLVQPDFIPQKNETRKVSDKKKQTKQITKSEPVKEVRPKGLIAYSVPSEMEVGQEYSVKVRITKQNDKTVLLVGDREIPISDNLDSVKVESITVSPIMSASLLSSKKDFEITPLSTDIQNIDDEGYTEWAWSVSPLQGGENNLKLNVKIRIKEDGNDYFKDITVFERKIKVKSNLGSSVKDFMLGNWEWFMGVIFIPLFQWLWLLWKRKKEEKDV